MGTQLMHTHTAHTYTNVHISNAHKHTHVMRTRMYATHVHTPHTHTTAHTSSIPEISNNTHAQRYAFLCPKFWAPPPAIASNFSAGTFPGFDFFNLYFYQNKYN